MISESGEIVVINKIKITFATPFLIRVFFGSGTFSKFKFLGQLLISKIIFHGKVSIFLNGAIVYVYTQ